jgi:hypothetical protein
VPPLFSSSITRNSKSCPLTPSRLLPTTAIFLSKTSCSVTSHGLWRHSGRLVPLNNPGISKVWRAIYVTSPSHKLSVGEFRGQKSVPGMLKVGTLKELFGHASRRVMNCLSITTSSHDIVTTPGLRYGACFLVNFPC